MAQARSLTPDELQRILLTLSTIGDIDKFGQFRSLIIHVCSRDSDDSSSGPLLTDLNIAEGSTETILRLLLPSAVAVVRRGLSIVTDLASSSSSGAAELLMQNLDGVMCIVQCCDMFLLIVSKISVQTRDARRAAVELAVLTRASGGSCTYMLLDFPYM
jgi:hypothetical protein